MEVSNLTESYLSFCNKILDSILLLEVESDDCFRVLSLSQLFFSFAGLNEKKIIGKRLDKLLPESSYSFLISKLKEVIRTCEPLKAEMPLSLSKEWGITDLFLKPILNEKGKCAHIIGFANNFDDLKQTKKLLIDIEEKRANEQLKQEIIGDKQLKEELKASEKWYQEFFHKAKDLLFLTRYKDGKPERFLEVNKAARQKFGYTKEEFLKLPPMDVLAPEEREHHLSRLEQFLVEKHDFCETEVITKDGRRIPVEINVHLFDLDGHPTTLNIARDITERKRTQRQILFQSSLLDQVRNAVIAIDNEGMITYWNKFAERLFQWRMEEVLGKNLFEVVIPKTDIKLAKEQLKKTNYSGHSEGEFIYQRKDGTTFPAFVTNTTIKDIDGKAIGFVSVSTDLTSQKQMVEEREKLQAQLFHAQKMEAIMTMSRGITLYFNNLLTVIQGYADLLRMKKGKKSLHEDAENLYTASTRAIDLVNQLLLFSRKQPIEPILLNINSKIESLLEMIKRFIRENITIELKLAPNLWEIWVDEAKIEQLIINLLINAKDAMPKGGKLTIKTENILLDEDHSKTIPEAQSGNFVCLSVEDTGMGMDKETIQRIFEPFFSTKELEEGIGLGLSVVYGIVKEHGGWINVYSELGEGSTFKICLPPISIEPEEEPIMFEKEIVKPEYEAPEMASLQKLQGNGEQILLVENEKDLLKLLSRIISENGYIVFPAINAEEAVNIFEREKGTFQIVFCDLVLPDKDGLELVEELYSRNPKLKVLMSSAYTIQQSQLTIIHEKGFRFLSKPYTFIQLLQAIKETSS